MDTKNRSISESKVSQLIILKDIKDFTDSDKHHIIQEYLITGCTKREIWKKYTGHEFEHGHLLNWMNKLGYTITTEVKAPNFIVENDITMPKKKQSKVNHTEGLDTFQLKKKIAELESKLIDSEMKVVLFSTMVDIAEKEFNIPIRKKYNTKSSKK